MRNAARLGQGTLTACYTAHFDTPTTATGGPFEMSVFFYYTGGGFNDQAVGELDGSGSANYCGAGTQGNQDVDGVNAVGGGCNNADIVSLLQNAVFSDSFQQTEPASLDAYAAGQINQALARLQRTIYAGLVKGTGSDPFTSPDSGGCNVPGVAAGGTVEAEVINYLQASATQVAANGPTSHDPELCISLLVQDRVAALTPAIAPHIIPSTTAGGASPATAAPLSLAARAEQSQPAGTASTVFAEDNPLIAPTLDRIDDTEAALSDEMANGTRLTVEVDGTGQGIVTGAGINCPGVCSASETPRSTATLTATPAPGSTFTGWSGACTGTGPCTVALPYDQNVIATFSTAGGAAATTQSAPSITSPTASATAAKCTLKVTSNKVLLKAPKGKPKKGAPVVKPGTLSLTVRCDHAGKVKLTGTLTQLIGAKPKHGKQKSKTYKLGPVNGSVTAGRISTLTVKLPAAAVTALGTGAKESAMFTAALTGASGPARATAKIATLKGH